MNIEKFFSTLRVFVCVLIKLCRVLFLSGLSFWFYDEYARVVFVFVLCAFCFVSFDMADSTDSDKEDNVEGKLLTSYLLLELYFTLTYLHF